MSNDTLWTTYYFGMEDDVRGPGYLVDPFFQ